MGMNILKKLARKSTEELEVQPNREWDFDIPFFKGDKWIEIRLEHNIWFSISAKELIEVESEFQPFLEVEDARPFFELAFRVPFRKEIFKEEINLN